MKSEYEIEAEHFAERHGLTMKTNYLGHYPRIGEYCTAQFRVTLTRGEKTYSFNFSQSLQESWAYYHHGRWVKGIPAGLPRSLWPKSGGEHRPLNQEKIFRSQVNPPTLYDVLSCVQSSDPGTHEEFCSGMGFDLDSRRGLQTYLEVQEEWNNIDRLFHDVIEELQEIN